MITHYEMSTGDVLATESEVTGFDWDEARAVQLRLQTIDEAKGVETAVASVIPADLIGVPVARILARFA